MYYNIKEIRKSKTDFIVSSSCNYVTLIQNKVHCDSTLADYKNPVTVWSDAHYEWVGALIILKGLVEIISIGNGHSTTKIKISTIDGEIVFAPYRYIKRSFNSLEEYKNYFQPKSDEIHLQTTYYEGYINNQHKWKTINHIIS